MPPHPLPTPRSHKAVSCGIQRHRASTVGFATPHKLTPCRDKGRGDSGEGDANFRCEISAMMLVRRGFKLRRLFTSRPMRLAASPLHAISATIRHRSAPSRNGT
jgi:hypothetical protein